MQQPVLQPVPVGSCLSERAFDFFVTNDASLVRVDQEHPSRLQSPFLYNGALIEIEYTHLGSDHDQSVVSHPIS